MITIDTVKNNGWLIFEGIVGSRAYGLDTATSDTDIKGVFVLPQEIFYSLDYVAQVSNESNDIVYYELRRFIELLAKNNPNILELLSLPDDCILFKHPVMNLIQPELFLSKQCEANFANYAYSQIKKARGLEKKISNPMEQVRKSVLDFCYVYVNGLNSPLLQFLEEKKWRQEEIGLSALTHMRDCYQMYRSDSAGYSGIIKKENANEVSLSSIENGATLIGLLYFNKDGYAVYCKRYKEYWDWVDKRNEARYSLNKLHGKSYDAKNMMHVFRLLLMAKEIAIDGSIHVRRTDRKLLLSIKKGKYEYEQMVSDADKLKKEITWLFSISSLQHAPDLGLINKLLITMRVILYKE